eukprot:CAMPEP_0183312878 /NCGR_PEP_ID=MMETSP0160_2-20130417/43374_1 /TAXON_ID=2839 ORGANISM="Odontella Sinensis, Strain Grunow 1884" /NCGR_SAMPLE_ID=MMETSP0160_2 /ASSEMBLY_ACC=CAM_ASM_000250 /LENGTH=41 /DNA_ID= /DNA_START= /DNA_END= /DNA_ORIENTATION=
MSRIRSRLTRGSQAHVPSPPVFNPMSAPAPSFDVEPDDGEA